MKTSSIAKWLMCLGVVVMFETAVFAAQNYGKTSELYAGFDYADVNRLNQPSLHGFLLGGGFAQNSRLRWVGEVTGLERLTGFKNIDPTVGYGAERLPQQLFQIHGGPELTRYLTHATLFAHTLLGYADWVLLAGNVKPAGFNSVEAEQGSKEGGFSIAAGAGVELPVIKAFGLRFAGDYISTFNRNNTNEFYAAHVSTPVPASRGVIHTVRLGVSLAFFMKRE
jgi:hypothetical protein